ncbi:MAG: DMT family transporter [Proteobacteria bacterium]|nr:DMT family transporter [Pseudomonadota bacterium]
MTAKKKTTAKKHAVTKKPSRKEQLRNESIGLTCVLVATLVAGAQSVVAKMGFALALTPLVMLVLRSTIFLPVYSLYMFRKFKPAFIYPKHLRKTVLYTMCIGALGMYVLPVLTMTALKYTSAGIVTVIVFTYPIFVILFNAVIMRVLPPFIHIATFFMIQVGIYLLLGGGTAALKGNLKGALLAFSVSVFFSCYHLMMKSFASRLGTRRYSFHAVMGAYIACLIHFFLTEKVSTLYVNQAQFLSIFAFTLVSFIPMFLLTESSQRIGVSRTALINSMSPFLTMIYAYFILGEVLSHQQVAGGFVVICSILLLEKDLLRLFIPRYRKRTTLVTTPD